MSNHPLMTVLYQRVANRIDMFLTESHNWFTTQKELNKLRKQKLKLEIELLEDKIIESNS